MIESKVIRLMIFKSPVFPEACEECDADKAFKRED